MELSKSKRIGLIRLIFFSLLIYVLSGCKGCGDEEVKTPVIETPESDIPIKEIELAYPVNRFDQELFSITPTSLSDTSKLLKKYPEFFPIYFDRLMRINRFRSDFGTELLKFINDKNVKEVVDSCRKAFPDITNEQKELQKALARYKYHFPDSSLPNLLTFICGFQYNVITTNNDLCIGLEMYLGESCKFYNLVQFPEYKTANMRREMMVPDAIRGFLMGNYDVLAADLLDQIIYHGKIMYAQAVLLPDVPEHIRFGYTAKQWDWCIKNEKNIWTHFVDQKLLYSTDFKDEVKYINDGPFTPGLSNEAPGRLGVWLGYRIVSRFVQNKNISQLSDLFSISDHRQIFQNSKYKPI